MGLKSKSVAEPTAASCPKRPNRDVEYVLRTSGIVLAFLLAWSMNAAGAEPPKIGDPAPEINGKPWINSQSLALTDLRGKVILVEFWTYG
jgi:hypothetical protein